MQRVVRGDERRPWRGLKLAVRQRNRTASGTTTLRKVVEWPPSVFESVIVSGTRRSPARLVDAPAAVTIIGGDETSRDTHCTASCPACSRQRQAGTLVQSGLYAVNVNSRGFNTFYIRHVLTRIDGRDPSPTILGQLIGRRCRRFWITVEQLDLYEGQELRSTAQARSTA
jgi:hypothetical protein